MYLGTCVVWLNILRCSDPYSPIYYTLPLSLYSNRMGPVGPQINQRTHTHALNRPLCNEIQMGLHPNGTSHSALSNARLHSVAHCCMVVHHHDGFVKGGTPIKTRKIRSTFWSLERSRPTQRCSLLHDGTSPRWFCQTRLKIGR